MYKTAILQNGFVAVIVTIDENRKQYTLYNKDNKRNYFIIQANNIFDIYKYRKNQTDFYKQAPTRKEKEFLIDLIKHINNEKQIY